MLISKIFAKICKDLQIFFKHGEQGAGCLTSVYASNKSYLDKVVVIEVLERVGGIPSKFHMWWMNISNDLRTFQDLAENGILEASRPLDFKVRIALYWTRTWMINTARGNEAWQCAWEPYKNGKAPDAETAFFYDKLLTVEGLHLAISNALKLTHELG